jgi:hypothetical protein
MPEPSTLDLATDLGDLATPCHGRSLRLGSQWHCAGPDDEAMMVLTERRALPRIAIPTGAVTHDIRLQTGGKGAVEKGTDLK